MKKGISLAVIVIVVAIAIGLTLGHKKTITEPATPSPATSASKPSVATSETAVSIKDFAFSPQSVSVKKGTAVTWTNNDSAAHTVTFDDTALSSASSGNLAKGATFSHTFDTAGTFKYHCAYHANMIATVVVTD